MPISIKVTKRKRSCVRKRRPLRPRKNPKTTHRPDGGDDVPRFFQQKKIGDVYVFFPLPTVLGSEVLDVFLFFLILFVCF